VSLLRALRPANGGGFVFPADRGKSHFQGLKGVWAKVVERARLSGVTPHTLRHTVGAQAASGGEALLMVGAILGHANARSTQIYAHVDRQPARAAAGRATARIADALGRTCPNARVLEPAPANDP
jgi:integrase